MKPWLLIPPKIAHDLAPAALQILGSFREPYCEQWRPWRWRGLEFANPLGIAGGVDKDGERIEDWWCFGPGFIEIGTVTPKAQDANPGKIIDRDARELALWNRMGFPSDGLERVRANLKDLPDRRTTPIFVNIGKNRDTSLHDAASDYALCISELAGLADVFVINISSPNTNGLRDLFQRDHLLPFLKELTIARAESSAPTTPLLLKLSPDLADDEIEEIARTAVDAGLDGFVATNTTLSRSPGLQFPKEGGVSGCPLKNRSEQVLQKLVQSLGRDRKDLLIVSVGGVMTPEDVFRRLTLGADLVQVYTALIYEGPGFFKRTAKAARKNSYVSSPVV